MLNYATQRHLSHILLIDSESPDTMQALFENALNLHTTFGEISGVSPYDHYTLILAFPASRSDLVNLASNLKQRSTKAGAKCVINAVRDADMFIIKGKAGLLGCSLFALAGAILVNDSPIPKGSAELILSTVNKSQGIHPIGEGLHAAIICNQSDIDQRLFRLPVGHNLEDILHAIGVISSRKPSSDRTRNIEINIPHIKGTAYDYPLNEFIDFVNKKNDLKFTAHAVAAIGKFLMVNHEVDAGAPWLQKTMPLIGHITVNDMMVEKAYAGLIERTKQTQKLGCGLVGIILVIAEISIITLLFFVS